MAISVADGQQLEGFFGLYFWWTPVVRVGCHGSYAVLTCHGNLLRSLSAHFQLIHTCTENPQQLDDCCAHNRWVGWAPKRAFQVLVGFHSRETGEKVVCKARAETHSLHKSSYYVT